MKLALLQKEKRIFICTALLILTQNQNSLLKMANTEIL